MKLLRVVVSDLHLGTGVRRGELNPFEDFHHDGQFAELLRHYDSEAGPDTEVELIMNGDIFDLLKVKIGGEWPTEITQEIASEKLQQCLEGHPVFVQAVREFVQKPNRRLTYLPGNHDLDMWFPAPQELLRRYIAPGPLGEKVRFVTSTDTYHLPEGIQIRHGHQLERIHAVDYTKMTRKRRDGIEILDLPWGSLWILEVMNPAKEIRNYIDRVQPFGRFIFAGLVLDTTFAMRFIWRSTLYFLRRRVFALKAWRDRFKNFGRLLREEIIALGGFDEHATRSLRKLHGVHTLIVGHSHAPRYRALPGNKILINTGTWMRMINLDLRYLGQDSGLTYALIEYTEAGKPRTSLMRWRGSQQISEPVFSMRIDPRWLLLLGLAAAPAAAQPTPSLTVTLTPPESLAVDDRAEVIATVAISPRNDGPILITPVSEGASVEVVRGRLSRPDADDPAANPLRFRIPIVARTPGTAVLRVHALGYACNARTKRCRSLETSTAAVLRVVAR